MLTRAKVSYEDSSCLSARVCLSRLHSSVLASKPGILTSRGRDICRRNLSQIVLVKSGQRLPDGDKPDQLQFRTSSSSVMHRCICYPVFTHEIFIDNLHGHMLRDWLTVLRSDDIEAIKLLKRQLLVHTGEGNANATDELLCHPLLRIYLAMLMHREQGQLQQALRLEVQLKELAVSGVARAAEFEWEEQHGLHNIDLGNVRLNHKPQLREDGRANS